MPYYCVNQDVLNLVPAIGSATTITSATIAQFISDSANEIDVRLVQRYTLPFSGANILSGTGAPPMVKTMNARMACFDLLTTRALAQFTEQQMKGNPFFDRLKEARSVLEDLAKGNTELLDSSQQAIATRADIMQVWSSTKTYNPTMHEGSDVDMVQDPDKLTSILGDRGLL